MGLVNDAASAAGSIAIAAAGVVLRKIILDSPLVRDGADPICEVQVRKPGAGELRGLQLLSLHQLDYGALETLLPRITMPMLSKAEIARLDPADLMQLGGEVLDFLLPKAAKPDSLDR